jgi:glycerol-3-phosphate dehydrogenase
MSGSHSTQVNSAAAPNSHYSVIIIGGGINGSGLFRDLCLQGVDCLLIEKDDFCSGASAAPSRLIHGGIKYLETGEFRLVKQSLVERNLLIKNAPHYAKPLPTVLPIYSWFGGIVPSVLRFFGRSVRMNDRGTAITEVGLQLYDLFGRHFRGMPRHSLWSRTRALAEMPDLTPKIVAAGLYYEGQVTHAERLGLELVLDGLRDNPASLALNHTAVIGTDGGAILAKDLVSGEEYRFTTQIVVNAGGAWIDKVNHALGVQSAHMGGHKGSHVILDHPELLRALRGRMVYFGSADGRVNLLYPFMGNVLVGSTDIPISDPDMAVCTEDEINYLISTVGEVFPNIRIDRSQVVYNYCGVRPLPRSSSEDPGAVSRDHSIAFDTLPNADLPVLSLIGGKWTTFRGFAEEAADLVLHHCGKFRRASTQGLPIGGGRDYPPADREETFIEEVASKHGLTRERVKLLFTRYGTKASHVAAWCASAEDRPLMSIPDYSIRELAFICSTELTRRLTDLLFRRTDIALTGRLNRQVILEAGQVAAVACRWDSERLNNEIAQAETTALVHGLFLPKETISAMG